MPGLCLCSFALVTHYFLVLVRKYGQSCLIRTGPLEPPAFYCKTKFLCPLAFFSFGKFPFLFVFRGLVPLVFFYVFGAFQVRMKIAAF